MMATLVQKMRGKKRKPMEKIEAKEEYFIKNGGALLEKQLSLFKGKGLGSERVKIFSVKDIEKATNNYDPNLIIGRQIARVFKGSIDDRMVAVKVANGSTLVDYPNEWLVDFFLNQVATKEVINHKHIVALYGCCLHTQVPTLVFEYFPNGTLYDHLHTPEYSHISWPNRVRIASEVAQALAYMHYGTFKRIVHMDIKTLNIFLDKNYTAKLANFGFSVSISPEDQFFKTDFIFGSRGYGDPEYINTLKLTEKCDVYSFGLVLVELLTGCPPHEKILWHANTVDRLILCIQQNKLIEIVDVKVMDEGKIEEIEQFSKLALWCIEMPAIARPTMIEVAKELRRIYQLAN